MKRVPVVLLVLAAGFQLAAQTPFRTGVEGVRVDALVTDGNRRVTGLTAGNFELRDNGILQRITDISREALPLDIICTLDVSGSVDGAPLVRLKDAMRALIDALADRDRMALMTFADRLRIHANLTDDRSRLRAILGGVEAGGSTALLDAIFAGLALRESAAGRTLLLLFSDGRDTASWLPARRVLESAQRTDVVIYPVAVQPQMRVTWHGGGPARVETTQGLHGPASRLLEALADETGGRVFVADNERRLRSTFVEVLSEFRQRYVLSYTPTGVSSDGWHVIDVKLKGRNGQVRARRGYFAARPTSDEASRRQRK
jgi:Ca-activated chloride channel family protein